MMSSSRIPTFSNCALRIDALESPETSLHRNHEECAGKANNAGTGWSGRPPSLADHA